MKNLSDFQAPPEGEITLCEVDGRVQSMNFEYANVNVFTNVIENHPIIHITRESLHPSRSGEDAKELFLSYDVPFTKQLVQIFYEQGYLEALTLAANHDQFVFSKLARAALKVVDSVDKVKSFWNPKHKQSKAVIIGEVSQTRNWKNGIFRCMAWHPDQTKIAVGTSDDVVRIYSQNTNLVPILRCKQQKNITAVAWRSLCDSEIAVACERYVIVWNVDPNSVVTRPSVSNAIILERGNHLPIVSLAWSPRGDVLATAAANDSTILMWDVELNRTSSLKRPGGSGNTILRWSQQGDQLFSATNSVVFRVWECTKWESEKWSVMSGRVQAACWSSCGKIVLFATSDEPIIYALSFSQSGLIFTKDTNTSPSTAVPIFDVTEIDIDGVIVGGIVQNLEWDPTGHHLAVIFRDTNYIAVFSVTYLPTLQINASCLIAGAPEESPCAIAFQKNFNQGSCLGVGWSSGRLQYFPIVYSDLGSTNCTRSNMF